MMLKTVYGPPPADMERIEAAEMEAETCVREQETALPPAASRSDKEAQSA